MSSFSPVPMTPAAEALDPSKHVNYTLGMVLGVDDFNQEFAYLSNRDQWLARDLLGYGTVCGLEVGVGDDVSKGKSIQVAPGVALNPHGQLIKVDPAQCAYLSAWLEDANTKKELKDRLKGATSIKVYLTLCYRDCPTDSVPVPGEPCRDESDALIMPSRIKDDFRLDLCFDAPDQTEENALREFVTWLRKIDVKASGASTPSLDKFEAAVSKAGEPVEPPDGKVMHGKPLASWHINVDDLPEYLRVAFRVWTTEIRPMWRGENADCVTPSVEECVMLAEITLKLVSSGSDSWALAGDSADVVLDEARRPYLLHLRMLQEWLFNSTKVVLKPASNVVTEKSWDQPEKVGTSLDYARADHTHGTPPDPIPPHQADPQAHELDGEVIGAISATTVDKLLSFPVRMPNPPSAGQVLTLVPALVPAEELPEMGNVVLAGDALPTEALPLSPKLEWRPAEPPSGATTLDGDVQGDAGANKIAGLQGKPVRADAPVSGQVLGFVTDHWEPVNQTSGAVRLGGDVQGDAGANRIVNLQGKPVDALSPQLGQVLMFTGEQWKPQALPNSGTTGDFVTRPSTAGAFGIVAAGVCEFNVEVSGMNSTYNKLQVIDQQFGEFGVELHFTFTDYNFEFQGLNYIIKLTPWVTQGIPFVAWVVRFDEIGFYVGVASPFGIDKQLAGSLMVEVSQFEPDQEK